MMTFSLVPSAPHRAYTLSLHDALPISKAQPVFQRLPFPATPAFSLTSVNVPLRSEEHTSELQSHHDLVCRLLLESNERRRHGELGRERLGGRDEIEFDARRDPTVSARG